MKFRVGQEVVVTAGDAQVNRGAVAKVTQIDHASVNPHRVRISHHGWSTWVTPDQIEHANAIEGLGGLADVVR